MIGVPWPLRRKPDPCTPGGIRPNRHRTGYMTDAAWIAREDGVLARLADAGGDLTAHETIHLEKR